VTAFVVRRTAAALLLVGLVVTATFGLLQLLPGGPGALAEDPRVPPRQRAELAAALGLDRPLAERYSRYVAATLRGDWGVSFAQQRPVAAMIAESAPHTAALAGAALLLEVAIGVPLGALAARCAGRPLDHALRAGALALWSLPSFWLGLALLVLFAVGWPLLPAGGVAAAGAASWTAGARFADGLAHLALPALALGLPAAAGTARFARAALLEVAGRPYLLAARARGLPRTTLFLRHALRPASATLVEVAGLSAAGLLSGSLAVEIVFSRPGLGRLAHDALAARDYPVLLAVTALAAAAVVVASLAADLLHAALDPRGRVRDARA
jgi:peptide/nickel transport system permease protein